MVMVASGRPLMVLKRPTADGDGDGGDVDGGDGDDDDADDDGVGDDGDGDGDDGDGDGDDGGRERVMGFFCLINSRQWKKMTPLPFASSNPWWSPAMEKGWHGNPAM